MAEVAQKPARKVAQAVRGVLGVRLALAAVFLCYFALSLYYNIINPVWEAPDEPAHYQHVLYIAENRTLPVRQAKQGDQLHQPPLYYIVGSLLIGGLGLDDGLGIKPNPAFIWREPRLGTDPNLALHTLDELPPYKGTVLAVHLLRVLSLLFGAVVVGTSYALTRRVLPDRPWLAVAVAGVTALTPQFLFVSATLGNDGPANASGSLALLSIVHIALDVHEGRRVSRRQFALLGLWIGLGAISKLTFFGVAPAVAVTAAYTLVAGKPRLHMLVNWLLSGALAAMLGGWWYVRNLLVYGTTFDIVGKGRFDSRTIVEIQEKPEQMVKVLSWYPEPLFQSFWLRFGWMSVYPDRWVYDLATAACLVALLGVGLYVVLRLSHREVESAGADLGLAICALALISAFAVTTWRFAYTIGNHYPQGRYLMPVQPAIALLLVFGLATVTGLRRRLVRTPRGASTRLGAVGAVVLCLALGGGSYLAAQGYIAPAYHYLPIWQRFDPATIDNRAVANFGGQLTLLGYSLESAGLVPNGRANLVLYWQAAAQIQTDLQAFVHIADSDGKPVAQLDGPAGGTEYTTSKWVRGEVIRERRAVPIGPQVAPADYRLLVGVYDFQTMQRLPLLAPAGTTAANLGSVTIGGH